MSGKEIATFSTSGGSTYDQAQKVMNELIGSDVKPGRVLSSKKDVENWLRDINFNHVAITKGNSEWLEPVSDEEYKKLG